MYSIFTYMTGSFIGYMFANIPAPWSTLEYVLIAIETGFPANYPWNQPILLPTGFTYYQKFLYCFQQKHKIEWFQVLQVNSPWRKQPQHDEFPMFFQALLYLALVMGGVYWSAGAWSRGILEANGTFDAQPEISVSRAVTGDLPWEDKWLVVTGTMEFSWLIYD